MSILKLMQTNEYNRSESFRIVWDNPQFLVHALSVKLPVESTLVELPNLQFTILVDYDLFLHVFLYLRIYELQGIF